MNENINVVFGIGRDGEYLFYVSCNGDCYFVYAREAKEQLDEVAVKKHLSKVSEEGLEYIKAMYNRWFNEYAKL